MRQWEIFCPSFIFLLFSFSIKAFQWQLCNMEFNRIVTNDMAKSMLSIVVILLNFLRVAQLLGVAGGRLSDKSSRTKCLLTDTSSETLCSVFECSTSGLWCMKQLELDGNIQILVVCCASISRWVKWMSVNYSNLYSELAVLSSLQLPVRGKKKCFSCNVFHHCCQTLFQ